MRLPRPFYQLPVLFDVARLQAEVAMLPPEAWARHPDAVPGNSAARLISAGGGENDDHVGDMRPTRWLEAMPYVRQVLAGFGVVWSRSRLMRLAPGVGVPEHADINYHWHTHVRLHIPVFTQPTVRFHCGDEAVHMAAGEAWIIDNWRRHRVDNGADADRIHLVADTSGTSGFWQFACSPPPPRAQWPTVPWAPDTDARPMTEADQRMAVMPAAEVQMLVEDLRAELAPGSPGAQGQVAALDALLVRFIHDWRQMCALHGVSGTGRGDFGALAATLHTAVQPFRYGADTPVMQTNGANAALVLEKRVLEHLVR